MKNLIYLLLIFFISSPSLASQRYELFCKGDDKKISSIESDLLKDPSSHDYEIRSFLSEVTFSLSTYNQQILNSYMDLEKCFESYGKDSQCPMDHNQVNRALDSERERLDFYISVLKITLEKIGKENKISKSLNKLLASNYKALMTMNVSKNSYIRSQLEQIDKLVLKKTGEFSLHLIEDLLSNTYTTLAYASYVKIRNILFSYPILSSALFFDDYESFQNKTNRELFELSEGFILSEANYLKKTQSALNSHKKITANELKLLTYSGFIEQTLLNNPQHCNIANALIKYLRKREKISFNDSLLLRRSSHVLRLDILERPITPFIRIIEYLEI